MIINHNMASLNTYNRLSANNAASSKSLEKLSSGLRINRAGDDAAGLAISEKMRGQIRGLDQAGRNAQDSISLIQTAEGALTESHSILQRMREIAVQSSNDTNTDSDRKELQNETTQLIAELDRIGNTTEFNSKKLLDGSAVGVTEEVAGSVRVNNNSSMTINSASMAAAVSAAATGAVKNGAYMIVKIAEATATTFNINDYEIIGPDGKTGNTDISVASSINISLTTAVVGAATAITLSASNFKDMKVGESITLVFGEQEDASSTLGGAIMTQVGANAGQTAFISVKDMRAEAIGVKDVDISTKFGAQTAIETVNNALEKVSSQRSALGAMQNRLEHTINNLGASSENLTAAESRIRDVDMAKEMMNFQKNNILSQAATAMLAQANQQPQGVLQLLQ
ncbi:flagellin [Desulfosporosinus fructosivorans]|uniref:Flagellin n=1 Tax=Desulfosporosinus fructosivorans TaxID=2018669 RepID=A0A4Z0RAY8_9FIRM|nr:flagellin [Desulfosporosinus fructosivorans]TGE39970.1 flagellin [Desulfosporosinus fructosivorans]